MQIARLHTRPDADIFDDIPFTTVTTDDGTLCTLPVSWLPAAGFLAENVFRRGIPAQTRAVEEAGIPAAFRRHEALGEETVDETDLRCVLRRLAGGWTYQAWKANAFDTSADACAFHDEILHLLLYRIAAPELAIFAQGGTDWAYGWPVPAFGFTQHSGAAGDRFLPVSDMRAESFITRKKDAEALGLAQSIGLRALRLLLGRVMDACDRDAPEGFDPAHNYTLDRAIEEARRAGLGEAAIEAAIACAAQGYEDPLLPRAVPEVAEDSAPVVLGLPDAFIEAALTGQGWMLHDKGAAQHRTAAEALWDKLAEAIWSSGAPHILFADHAQSCFEAATQSSRNGLIAPPGCLAPAGAIDVAKCTTPDLSHAALLMTVALDTMACGQHRAIALAPANLAAHLLRSGVAYDSAQGVAAAAMTTALLSASAHRASAALAASAGVCPAYAALEKPFLATMQEKMAAFAPENWSGRTARATPARCPDLALAKAAQSAWAQAYVEARAAGMRNMHLTCVVEDADIQILLGTETPGIAPIGRVTQTDGSGAYGRTLSPAALAALKNLGYSAAEVDDLAFHAAGNGTLLDAPFINHVTLAAAGFDEAARVAVETALKTAHHIRDAFNPWILSADFLTETLGFDADDVAAPGFDLLFALGFSEAEITAAHVWCCGTGTLEGAAQVNALHVGVFNTDISADARLRMQAALEIFLSGSAAQSLALPRHATIDDVQKLILRGWELGVKTMAIYRDASSILHAAAPLQVQSPRAIVPDVKASGILAAK